MNIIQKSQIDLQPFETQALIFKMLTHPVRIAILEILRNEEHCVCHMEAHLGLRQAYLSQQLSVLREADLIQDRRDGWNIFYRVTNPEIFTVLDAIKKFTRQAATLPNENSVSCNCPHCSARNYNP